MTQGNRRKQRPGPKAKPAASSPKRATPEIAGEVEDSDITLPTSSLLHTIPDGPDAFVILDCDGRFLEVSPAVCSRFGLSRDALIGCSAWDFLPDKVTRRRKEAFEEAVETLEIVRFEDERQGRFFDNVIYPIADSDPRKTKFVVVARDITEQKIAREELRESKERYQLVLERTSDLVAITTFSAKPTYVYVNPASTEVLHYSPEDMIGKCAFDFIHPEDKEKLVPLMAQYVAAASRGSLVEGGDGPTEKLLYRFKDGRGNYRYLESTGDLLEDSHILFVSRDVTEKIRKEEYLKRAREELEEQVKKRTRELEDKSRGLEEMNVALRVLLNTREREQKELAEKVRFSVRELADPYIQKLKNSGLSEVQKTWLEILESSLQEVTSPFLSGAVKGSENLTPSELQVVNLIRLGRTSKEIAEGLGLSTKTVETHRRNIRKKLGLKKKTNLRSYLLKYQNP